MTITAAGLSLLQASRMRERRAATRADARPVPELTRAWRDDALVDDGTHAAYLAGQLLDGDDLVALLAGDAWTPRAASADWLARVDPWLVHTPVSAEAYAPANGHLVVEDTRVAGLPFAALLGPMVGAQRAHLDGRPWLSRTARADLLDGLAERLATLSLRALLAELARDPAPGRHARLEARLADPAHRAELLSRHPVLARDLVTAIGSWRAHVARILDRLHADHGDLVRMGLAPERLDALEAVDLSSGDPHDGGQSVATLRFSDGSRLVYKPRDCRVFALYRDLVDALAPALHGEIRLRAAAVLPRDGYGWVEFVAHAEDAASAIPLSRHLGRLGSLLAVAHVLGASDLHLENVIASADGPVPIDLETLIQNRSEVDGEDGTALRRASRMLNASVLGSGILPVQLTTGQGTSIDVSVSTGGLHGAGTTATVHQVVDAATDRMRIEAREMPVGRSRNQPPGATLARIRSGRAALADGYERTFRAIVERRAEVRAILSAAPDISSRHIVRATRSYSLLLTEMRRPRPLRSGIDRDRRPPPPLDARRGASRGCRAGRGGGARPLAARRAPVLHAHGRTRPHRRRRGGRAAALRAEHARGRARPARAAHPRRPPRVPPAGRRVRAGGDRDARRRRRRPRRRARTAGRGRHRLVRPRTAGGRRRPAGGGTRTSPDPPRLRHPRPGRRDLDRREQQPRQQRPRVPPGGAHPVRRAGRDRVRRDPRARRAARPRARRPGRPGDARGHGDPRRLDARPDRPAGGRLQRRDRAPPRARPPRLAGRRRRAPRPPGGGPPTARRGGPRGPAPGRDGGRRRRVRRRRGAAQRGRARRAAMRCARSRGG